MLHHQIYHREVQLSESIPLEKGESEHYVKPHLGDAVISRVFLLQTIFLQSLGHSKVSHISS